MSEASKTGMKPTLGLTGLTVNAMALIAPGAFLWLTFGEQSIYGAPWAGSAMWFGIVLALLLCFATAVSYAELSKLYPGAGSSYVFAEQAFLAKSKKAHLARLAKFIIGWASHLYYWIYPGVMVTATAIVAGYLVGQIWPGTFSAATPSPIFMYGFCVIFAFLVAYIAYRGISGATGVNIGINVIQITALMIFAVLAIGYRASHGQGKTIYTLDPDGHPTTVQWAVDSGGNPVRDASGTLVPQLDDKKQPVQFTADYGDAAAVTTAPSADDPKQTVTQFQFHQSASSVVAPHNLGYVFIQAGIAILLLVGFESVTSMGEEARNPKKDIPRAVLLSLVVQGAICYLFEYFAANYFLNSGYGMTTAAGSAAPIGDMMQIVGSWALGGPKGGYWFMIVEAVTVILALVGTTLSCINTGARVTYAMGRDEEVPSHFGLLHGKTLTPHRSIWVLATISAVIGIYGVAFYFCGPSASLADSAIQALPANFWYSFGFLHHDTAARIPQSFLVITLASNFGTFLLYMLTNYIAMVAFKEHHMFNGFKHLVVPTFGLLANLVCMGFYLVGPFLVPNMSKKEPYVALAIAALWGLYGMFYFIKSSKQKGKPILLDPSSLPASNTPVQV